MPRSASQENTDSTSVAQGRFTVALPRDVGDQIDELGALLAENMRAQYGVGVELSRAQVVTSLVKSGLQTFKDTQATQASDGAQA